MTLRFDFQSESLPATASALTPELSVISEWLTEIQRVTLDRFPDSSLYLGGGSSRGVLDHLYFRRPIEMRDMDIFVIRHGEIVAADLVALAEDLQSAGVAKMVTRHAHSKHRYRRISAPGGSPIEGKFEKCHVGYTLHLTHSRHPILSLSLLPSLEMLRLNGIVDFDRVLIPLFRDRNLVEYSISNFLPYSYDELAPRGIIDDCDGGYVSWVNGSAENVIWENIVPNPVIGTFRLVRNHLKVGRTRFSELQREMLITLLAQPSATDEIENLRYLLKVIGDEKAEMELFMLLDVQALKWISPDLQAHLQNFTPSDLKRDLARAKARALESPLSDAKTEEYVILEHWLRFLDVAERERLLQLASFTTRLR